MADDEALLCYGRLRHGSGTNKATEDSHHTYACGYCCLCSVHSINRFPFAIPFVAASQFANSCSVVRKFHHSCFRHWRGCSFLVLRSYLPVALSLLLCLARRLYQLPNELFFAVLLLAETCLLRVQNNGAGVSRCRGVAPGATNANDSLNERELCCFPYLTGNAVFPACNGNGLGLYHHIDVEHIVEVKSARAGKGSQQGPTDSSGTSRTASDTEQQAGLSLVVIDMEAEGLTGELIGEQVCTNSLCACENTDSAPEVEAVRGTGRSTLPTYCWPQVESCSTSSFYRPAAKKIVCLLGFLL